MNRIIKKQNRMKLIEKQQRQIDFFIKRNNATHEKVENVHILRYETEIKGVKKPASTLFIGNSCKPKLRYYYANEERREERINEVVERQRKHLAEQERKKAERKAFIPTTAPGDVFVSSWGYEQTNVDFYLCQEVKGKTGTFIRIGSKKVEGSDGHDCCRVVADKETTFGDPFKKLIKKSGDSESIRLKSYEYCHKWNGSSMYRSWGY